MTNGFHMNYLNWISICTLLLSRYKKMILY